MMVQFQIGDVVRLKSGGPAMTVEHVGTNALDQPTVWCCWFDNTEKKNGTFPPQALEAVQD